jgi:hypothetical protein
MVLQRSSAKRSAIRNRPRPARVSAQIPCQGSGGGVSDVLSDAEEDVHHQRMALEPRQVVVHQPDGGAVVAVDGALLQPEGDCAAGGLRHVARAE